MDTLFNTLIERNHEVNEYCNSMISFILSFIVADFVSFVKCLPAQDQFGQTTIVNRSALEINFKKRMPSLSIFTEC